MLRVTLGLEFLLLYTPPQVSFGSKVNRGAVGIWGVCGPDGKQTRVRCFLSGGAEGGSPRWEQSILPVVRETGKQQDGASADVPGRSTWTPTCLQRN